LSLLFFGKDSVLCHENERENYLKENLKDYYNFLITNKKINKNKYKGINKCKNGFNVRVGSPRVFVGFFSNEEDAVLHRNKVLYYLYGDNANINIDESLKASFAEEGERIWEYYNSSDKIGTRKTKKIKNSIYKGISKYSTNLWEASLTCDGKRWRETGIKTEIEAAKIFDKKIIELGLNKNRLNFPI
jgi:hypothetical protein